MQRDGLLLVVKWFRRLGNMNNVLIAKEGYIYTNGETFGYTIRLGVNDSADNWHEITKEEYDKIVADEGGDS